MYFNSVSQLILYERNRAADNILFILLFCFFPHLLLDEFVALDHLTETPKAQSTNDTNSAKKSQHIDHHHFDYHHHENESKPARKRKHGRKDKHSHTASNKLRKSSSGRDEVINIDTDNDIHADNVTEIGRALVDIARNKLCKIKLVFSIMMYRNATTGEQFSIGVRIKCECLGCFNGYGQSVKSIKPTTKRQ